MELLKAIISIFLGVIFLSFIIRISYPLLVIFALFILYMIIKTALINRRFRNASQNMRQAFEDQQDQSQNTSNNPNVIDAEYTEEELD